MTPLDTASITAGWPTSLARSTSIANFQPAFRKAQAMMAAITKDKTGKVLTKSGAQYEYRYSDLAAVIDAVKAPLNDNEISFYQTAEIIVRDDSWLTTTTTLVHDSGEFVAATVAMRIPDEATPQTFGSLFTYGKRYSLQSIVGLPSEDDDAKKATDASVAASERKRAKPMPAGEFYDHSNAINAATDETSLRRVYSAAYLAAQTANDPDALKRFSDLKDGRKAALGGPPPASPRPVAIAGGVGPTGSAPADEPADERMIGKAP